MSAQPSELTQGLRPGETKIFCPGLGFGFMGLGGLGFEFQNSDLRLNAFLSGFWAWGSA